MDIIGETVNSRSMTSRQRIVEAIHFRPVDRLPVYDHLWEGVAELWKEQGMPRNADPDDYFGFDAVTMFLDVSPGFEMRVLKRSDGYITYVDRFGYTCRKPDGKSGTLEFIEHPVSDRDAWEKVKRGFLLADEPARIDSASYFAHFDPYPTWAEAGEKFRRLHDTGRYVLFMAYGPWEAAWRMHGFEGLLLDVALDPDWVREMADTYMDFLLAVLRRCVNENMKPDGFILCEDLGSNKGPFISPNSWRALFRPAMTRLGETLAENQIDFWMHSCGNAEVLFDDFVDCGLRVMNPLQVSAGLDVVELRKRYGKRPAWWGNISAKDMAGPRDHLERDIRRKVSTALDGGYIFASDHSVPPDVSFEWYCWILQTAREAAGRQRR